MKRIISFLMLIVMCCVFLMGSAESKQSNKILIAPEAPLGKTISIPVGEAEFIRLSDGSLITIADLTTFSNQNEATAFIQGIRAANNQPVQYNPTIDFNSRATHGNALVASITYNYMNTVGLWVEYTTSGDSSSGHITYHSAYTSFTGFTLGIAWHQVSAHSEVTSSGKDIYATARGELAYYLLVDGLIELGRESVDLSGYCYVIH